MKKLLSLLIALCLLLVPMAAWAEDGVNQSIYQMVAEELTSAGLRVETFDNYGVISFQYTLNDNSEYGNMDVFIETFTDGFTINVSYTSPIDNAIQPQTLSFFNYLNSYIYVGKLLLSELDDTWYPEYEIFVSVDPDDIRDWDRTCVMDYVNLALYVMQYMPDYLNELASGETPKNVSAMWQSDNP